MFDIAKWGGPASDWGMKVHEIAPYMFWPGWHKPGQSLLFEMNLERYEALPADFQKILELSAGDRVGKYSYQQNYNEGIYFKKYKDYGETFTKLDAASLQKMKDVADRIMAEKADANPLFKEIWQSQKDTMDVFAEWADWASFPPLE